MSGAEVPPSPFGNDIGARWLKENRKGNHRQRYSDDAYLLMFVAGLDEWLGSAEIHVHFPDFNKDKVRRIRRLTYSDRINDMIRNTLPKDIAVPQDWQRWTPLTPETSNTGARSNKSRRQAPSLDVLADRLDALRIDGLTTIRYWNNTTT